MALRQAVLADPSDSGAWANLAAACDAQQRNECALQCYHQAYTLGAADFKVTYILAILVDRIGHEQLDAVELFKEAARQRPRYVPTYCRVGRVLEKRGDFELARRAYEVALERDPDFGIAERLLGQLLLRMDDAEAALPHLKRAAELVPEDGAVYAALAQAYRRLGQADKARAAAAAARDKPVVYDIPDPARAAIKSKAIDAQSLLERALVHLRHGQHDEALPLLEMCLEAWPENPQVHDLLGRCYKRTGQPDAAIEHFQKATAIEPTRGSAHLELASVLIEQGRAEEAWSHYQKAAELHPDNVAVHTWIADFLLRAGEWQRAIKVFEQAAMIGQLDARQQVQWGVALLNTGEVAQAANQFRIAITLKPDYGKAHYNLGLTLRALGETDEADKHFQRARELGVE